MFEHRTTKVVLEQPLQKVRIVYWTQNDTFVFLQETGSYSMRERIVHVDKNGKVLFKTKAYYIKDIVMMTPTEVIVSVEQSHKIDIIDLTTYNITQHELKIKNVGDVKISAFTDSKLIAVSWKDKRDIYISYYDYQGFKNGDDPLSSWKLKSPYAFKINEHSKMMVEKCLAENSQIFLSYLDLKDNPKGQKLHLTIKNNVKIPSCYLENFFDYFWEMRSNVYLAIRRQLPEKTKKNKTIWKDHICQIDATKGNEQSTIRQLFLLEGFRQGKKQTIYKAFNLGEVSVLMTILQVQGEDIPSKMYMIDNQTSSLLDVRPWQATNKLQCFSPQWNPRIIEWFQQQQTQLQEWTIHKLTFKSKFSMKEFSMHLLLHFNQDFDDDLLQDSIELLHD